MSAGRAIVVGGSLAGLLSANMLLRDGWDVHVYERSPGVLEGRGAGITILPGLVDGLAEAGVDRPESSWAVPLLRRVALGRDGEVLAEFPYEQGMTSWRRLFELLRDAFPSERYHAGRALEAVEGSGEGVVARFADGEIAEADVLVGADGLRSSVRRQFLPDVEPGYSGYIAWRCLTDEARLSAETRELLRDAYAMCIAPGEQAVGYYVPGPDGRFESGRRQLNVVWYHAFPDDELKRLLTDADGRHHPGGIPPSLLTDAVRAEIIGLAQRVLAPQFAEAVVEANVAFFQPIVDLALPRLVFGRVAIVGDAACVARPHTAMGVPKAAGDVLALRAALRAPAAERDAALAAFERERLAMEKAAVGRGKELGAYMASQLADAQTRETAERGRDPEAVLRETAVPYDYAGRAARGG